VPEIDGGSVLGARARSASDAAVLRRKGHLKEQDLLIEFLLSMHNTHTSLEAMQKMERWIVEHRQVRTNGFAQLWNGPQRQAQLQACLPGVSPGNIRSDLAYHGPISSTVLRLYIMQTWSSLLNVYL